MLTKREQENFKNNEARNSELQKIKNLQEEIEQLEDASMTERLNNLRKEKDEKLYDQQLLLLKKKEELEDCIKTRVWKFKNLTKKSRKRSSTKSRKRRGTKSPKRRSAKSPKRRGIKKLI